ncbi:hypothetical protein [Mammaliicoccus sciuri]|uniref:hypothetical protein n=1 Tax=Mammaliicoccus sciuri TaxID=1296 RepID=UPI001F8C1EDA|nr:hypothetical protein SSCS72_02900 [Mammaliicoccus sciuri]
MNYFRFYCKVESKQDTQIIEILKIQIETLKSKKIITTIEFYRKELQERSKFLENQTVENAGGGYKDVPKENHDNSLEENELLNDNNLSEEIKTDHDDKIEQVDKKRFWSPLFGM